MNHLEKVGSLRNEYFIIRHGQSIANVQGILLSYPESGVPGFGLTPIGFKQAEDSAKAFVGLGKDTLIFSSDFARARETAETVKKVIEAEDVHLTPLLRERYFGDFERMASHLVHDVWHLDTQNPNHKTGNSESPNEVMARVTKYIVELEEKYSGKKILLVSHGDPLQILQAAFLRKSADYHKQIPYIKNAEIRKLVLAEVKG